MVIYRESGVELIQARGEEGRFQYLGESMRLGAYAEGDSWYIGVHRSNGGLVARLTLEDARTLKEAKDMLKYGFFLQIDDNLELIRHIEQIGLLSAPALAELNRN
ncbi:MAG: hypothetical protein GC160_22580 [Acidobacteria bacterium]|nr:hypothetical protein [Acidobacteriota bacterium]